VENLPVTAPSDADKPASGPAGAKPDASRPLPTGAGTPGKDQGGRAPSAGAPSPAPQPASASGEAKTDGKPITTASGATTGPAGAGPKPAPLASASPAGAKIDAGKAEPPKSGATGPEIRTQAGPATTMGADAKAGPAGGAPKSGPSAVVPPGPTKAEPPKTETLATGPKPDTGKPDTGKPDPLKTEAAKAAAPAGGVASKSEPAKADPAKTEQAKPDPLQASGPSARPGGPAGPVAGATVTAGPILDLKATRVPDPSAAGAAGSRGKDTPKDSSKDAPGASATGQAKSPGSGPAPRIDPASGSSRGAASVASPAKSGAGFGSIAAAGLIGGVIGAGLLLAVERAGIGGEAGQVSALDQKLSSQIAALDQRVGTLAPKDALGPLDKRVAAAEASAKQASEKAASLAQAQGQGAGNAAVPADLASRLDNLDQRVSALQEEPGRDASGTAGMGVAQIESSRQLADLDARVKTLEGAGPDGNANNSAETAKALASLKGDVESRTKQNADAVAALGQRVDGLQQSLGQRVESLQQSLGDRVKSATEAVQAATEASRKAAEANQTQVAEASKAVDRRLAEQADKIASLDKGLADRAPASTVQAALRVVVADRIASALASGTPYAEPLATLTKLDPQAQGQASALKPFADKGAPTAGQLAETFRGIAQSIAQSRRAAQTKAASESGDFRTKLFSMADGLVQVRKVDGGGPAEGPAAAPEEKVQTALDRGDLEGASAAFDAMPAEAKAQAGDFGATLAARAKAAQASRTLTASAFSALPAAPASK
jgi:hypothetical protein